MMTKIEAFREDKTAARNALIKAELTKMEAKLEKKTRGRSRRRSKSARGRGGARPTPNHAPRLQRLVRNRVVLGAAEAGLLPQNRKEKQVHRHQDRAERAKLVGRQADPVMIEWIKPLQSYHTK